jgi:NADH:ubiquinone oxidoreductase subunit K
MSNSGLTDAAYGIPLVYFLIVAAALFCLGLFAALRRTNVIMLLMGLELMLNAVNLNLVAFSRYTPVGGDRGQAFAVFVLVIAAAEAAVGLALAIIVSRRRNAIEVEKIDLMKG